MQCRDCVWRELGSTIYANGGIVGYRCALPGHAGRVLNQDCPHDAARIAALVAQIGEGQVIMSQELASHYLRECQWAQTGDACAGETTGCRLAVECQARRKRLEVE